ncbi:MAG: F0F1 ATP synthase subunit A, partial [Fimbriimonadaceae bacterium]
MSGLLQAAPTLLAAEAEGGKAHASTSIWGVLFYVTLTLVVLFALMGYAKKGLQPRFFTNPITQLFEQLYLFVENMTVGVIGPRGRKYIPMVMVLWMVIFVGNFIALFFPTSQTANLSFNLGMALLAVGYVQWEGIRQNGFFGHLSHFAGPKLGIGLIAINIIVFLIELISELMKNVSLSLRLYGNIDGGHRAAVAMNDLGKHIIGIGPVELSIPF